MELFDAECRMEMIRLWETGHWRKDMIAPTFGTGVPTVNAILRAYKPTQQLAERHIQANALQLAERLTATVKAPADIADVLSRPNIGVLKPHQRDQPAPQILLSVTQQSLGGVMDVTPSAGATLPAHVGPEAALPPVSVPLATAGRLGLPPPRAERPSPARLSVAKHRQVAARPHHHQDGTPATVVHGRVLRPDEEVRHRQGQKRSRIHLSDPPDHFETD